MGLQEEGGGEGGFGPTMQAKMVPLHSAGEDRSLFHYGELSAEAASVAGGEGKGGVGGSVFGVLGQPAVRVEFPGVGPVGGVVGEAPEGADGGCALWDFVGAEHGVLGGVFPVGLGGGEETKGFVDHAGAVLELPEFFEGEGAVADDAFDLFEDFAFDVAVLAEEHEEAGDGGGGL